MRLMIGCKERPELLVNVDTNYDPNDFDFYVINGNWDGHYHNGFISVFECPGGDFTPLEKYKILTDSQHRLRGDYQTVFREFRNVSYVAPFRTVIEIDIDDVPF